MRLRNTQTQRLAKGLAAFVVNSPRINAGEGVLVLGVSADSVLKQENSPRPGSCAFGSLCKGLL